MQHYRSTVSSTLKGKYLLDFFADGSLQAGIYRELTASL